MTIPDGTHNIGGNRPNEYSDTDTYTMGGRLHRMKAPIASVICRTTFICFLSSFLDQIGKYIFMNKCIKCNSQNVAMSTNDK